ncbi:MerR family transcriptional regulator [Nocardia sp. NPDC052254]|uniref:MerR family transcriptional regulator n=1 Tax=Nocardia sp. NPDC052254 TaxID=3155681 RepID=UPI0034176CA5
MDGLKIGDAAAAVGVEPHVLRHWESVGLLYPARSGSGHRAYDSKTLDQARLIRAMQRTGLSLSRIRELGLSRHEQRLALLADERARLRRRIELYEATDRFLAHIAECKHSIIAECPGCSAFVTGDGRTEEVRQDFSRPAGRRPTGVAR